jgi:sterol desaturase/sphingolipid hydroxylase (fatty acid hydroxylase superfamily)
VGQLVQPVLETAVDKLILTAIPFFVVFMAVELLTLRLAAHHDHHGEADPDERDFVGYEPKDTATSLSMGLGNVAITAGWKLVVIAVYAGLYSLTPLRLDPADWWTWVLLFFADDLAFYLYHRGHHRVRMFWATHVVHHSSQHFNLSTALRQDWTPFTGLLFWLWLPLVGFEPWMIVLAHTWSLLFQFLLHTEAIDKLPRPIEWCFNTPSHHRVHHGSQEQYLDKNYGGILIIWDRLFGTFEPEGERVRYGLTTNIETYNPVRVATHEWADMLRDVRRAPDWRTRAGYLLHGPGWSPEPGDADRADAHGGSTPAPAPEGARASAPAPAMAPTGPSVGVTGADRAGASVVASRADGASPAILAAGDAGAATPEGPGGAGAWRDHGPGRPGTIRR